VNGEDEDEEDEEDEDDETTKALLYIFSPRENIIKFSVTDYVIDTQTSCAYSK